MDYILTWIHKFLIAGKGNTTNRKGKAMKYETPELTALTPAINAIQGSNPLKVTSGTDDGGSLPAPGESNPEYAD